MTKAVRRTGGLAVAAVLGLLTARPPDRLTAQDSLPAGYGTLKRDDIAVRLASDQIELQVLPLDEQVIRLLAPDTYRSLAMLITARRTAIDSLARQLGLHHPTLVLVTFFGLVPQARFTPEDVNLGSSGQLFRPVGIVPLSPRWGSNQLDAREQATAIYVFEQGVSLREDLTISYQGMSSDAWARSARALDQERARVRGRAAASH